MLSLFFHACASLVTHITHSLAYAAAALLFFWGASSALLQQKSFALIAPLFILFTVANTLYIHASTRQLQQHDPRIDYLQRMRWRREHSELLIFIVSGSMLLAALAFYLSDVMFTFREIAEFMKQKQYRAEKQIDYWLFAEIAELLIFGAQFASLLLLLISLWLWNFFCRIGIRIPALTAGYYLRTEEALHLTRPNTFAVTTLSLFFIVSISSLADIVITQKLLSEPSPPLVALVITVAYFLLAQLHIGMWVALYDKSTVEYKMSRLHK